MESLKVDFDTRNHRQGSTEIISFVNSGNSIKNCCWVRKTTTNKRNI